MGPLSSHSQFYMFSTDLTPQGGPGHPATDAGFPPQLNPELTSPLRIGHHQGDRPQEHSPEMGAEGALPGLWSGRSGAKGASHPAPPGPSDGSTMAGPGWRQDLANCGSHLARDDTENGTFRVKSSN